MKTSTISSMALVAATQFLGIYAQATRGVQKPYRDPVANELTSHGCYLSLGNLTRVDNEENNSSGSCSDVCTGKKKYVMAVRADKCYCGMVYPPLEDKTKDANCNFPCPGYGQEACGAAKPEAYSVFNTGVEILVDDMEPVESSTTAAPSSTEAAESTAAEKTAVVTETEGPAASSGAGDSGEEDKKDGPNVAAIAAGSVVGVVVVAAIIGGAVFFVRRKRNAEIEEEHRRNAAVNAFINGSKPPGSSGSISMTDSRLDPVMAHRRLSDGSIADNQDYSRRILRVTNA
ncbi:hypothetical protein ACJ41O_011552 [Fusarium nematophilum]